MALRTLYRLTRSELGQTLRRPSFSAFFFLLSMLMLFEMSLQTQGYPLPNPMKSIIPASLVYSNFIVALYLSYLSASSIAKEYEERTMNILLTVPMRRSEVYLGKMASLACVIPLIMAFDAVYILSLTASYGALPDIELSLIPYELLVSALFFLSVIALTMLLAAVMRSSSFVLIFMTIFLFLSAFLGLPVLVTGRYTYSLSYASVFLMPASVMISAFRITETYCMVDSTLPVLQLLFIAVAAAAGIWLFRRSDVWG
jgi:ABC-type transport system involved in multi-copper enzyme maturation permease subunit